MLSTLAQAEPVVAEEPAQTINIWDSAHHVFQTSVDIFSRGDTLASPSELIPELAQLGQLWAIVFVVVGLVCLLKGYTFHKIMTVALLVVLGAGLGYWMGLEIQGPPFVVAGCVSVLLAVMAFPLMKYAVAVLGGLSGAFIGSNLWAGLGRVLDKSAAQRVETQGQEAAAGDMIVRAAEAMPADAYWAGALVGLIVCGLAAFALSKITIHLFTTVSGSTIAVFGVIALLLSIDTFRDTVATELTRSPLIIPLLVFVPAAIGFLMQEKASGAWGGNGDQAAAT
ncbi:MAG: hypothetical protein KTR15_11230 [Phycisphaeraceae bacterium]|nr:hypothetical protein [Phycisphaeraceae bacterium]